MPVQLTEKQKRFLAAVADKLKGAESFMAFAIANEIDLPSNETDNLVALLRKHGLFDPPETTESGAVLPYVAVNADGYQFAVLCREEIRQLDATRSTAFLKMLYDIAKGEANKEIDFVSVYKRSGYDFRYVHHLMRLLNEKHYVGSWGGSNDRLSGKLTDAGIEAVEKDYPPPPPWWRHFLNWIHSVTKDAVGKTVVGVLTSILLGVAALVGVYISGKQQDKQNDEIRLQLQQLQNQIKQLQPTTRP